MTCLYPGRDDTGCIGRQAARGYPFLTGSGAAPVPEDAAPTQGRPTCAACGCDGRWTCTCLAEAG